MKKVLRGILAICLILCLSVSGVGTPSSGAADQNSEFPDYSELTPFIPMGMSGYQVIAVDGDLQLMLDEVNLKVAVQNIKSGVIWESTPSDVDSDLLAAEETVFAMHDLVQLDYFAGSTLMNSMGSYKDCVQKEQFQIYLTECGFVAVLTLGEGTGAMINPEVLSVETFENVILPALADNERAISRMNYLYKRRELSDFSEDRQAEMLEKYPALAEGALYIAGKLNKSAQKEVDEYMKTAGFTLELLQEEYQAIGFEMEKQILPSFEIPLWFTLENGTLKVRIDTAQIKYDADHFYIHQIKMLPYFGAARVDEEGYLFFPVGSGTVIDFNQDKHMTRLNILGKVYGADMSLDEDSSLDIQCPLPVFGIRRGDRAMLGVITQGAGDAYLQVENGNIIHSYAVVRSYFGVHYKITQEFYGSESGVMQKEKAPYLEKTLEQTYHFLEGEQAGLSGMAEVVRKGLQEQGMTSEAVTGKLPLFLETLGAVETAESPLPWENQMRPLTTFAQTESILADLQEAGIGAVNLRLKGIANGGLQNYPYASMQIEGAVGSREELAGLVSKWKEKGVAFYPDACLSTVMRERFMDGFSATDDTARRINGRITMLRSRDIVTGVIGESEHIMMTNAAFAKKAFPSLLRFAEEVGCGLSLSGIGKYVNTDFSEQTRASRTDAADTYQSLLSQGQADWMVDYGNAYVLPEASAVVDMPVEGINQIGCGETVPFLQMVCFGLIDYSTSCINDHGDTTMALLKCVEMGASPYFVTAYDNLLYLRTNEVGQTYCHVSYGALKEEIVQGYQFVEKALAQVRGSRMVSYRRVTPQLSVTGYSNGITICVNFGEESAEYQGQTVEPHSYAVIETAEDSLRKAG